MKELYREIDCLVHPTYYPEGMSNVIQEAMATGRPVITTNRHGCKELVDNGVSGYLIKEESYSDLYDNLIKFIELDNKEKELMGLKGRKKVEEEFSRDIVISNYIDEINRLVKD